MFFKKGTMLMSRTGERAVIHRDILTQGVEKWRQHVLFITTGCGFQFQKLLRVSAYHCHHPFRNLNRLRREDKDRKLEPCAFQ
ncbi:hypothetical protein D3C87_1777470 [compost metagenome]